MIQLFAIELYFLLKETWCPATGMNRYKNRPLSNPICRAQFLEKAQSPTYSTVFEEHR
ncbi:hypothetical protein [Cardinium endosymbiont of Philonthus spinipes]|uniref:hypothetical protein n=1 Tax=Cardinium endosymbiont of Philonthus spinipes TaxID=3077941 RepID=UPI00313CDB9C